jgi:hypothetical protein
MLDKMMNNLSQSLTKAININVDAPIDSTELDDDNRIMEIADEAPQS